MITSSKANVGVCTHTEVNNQEKKRQIGMDHTNVKPQTWMNVTKTKVGGQETYLWLEVGEKPKGRWKE